MAKIKNEKAVLMAFCEKMEGFQHRLMKPFVNDRTGEVWASDGHMLLMMNPKLVRRKYETSNYGNALIFPDSNSDTLLTLDDVKKAFNTLDLKPETRIVEGETVECPHCGGYGEVQWEFTDADGETHYMEYECPCCNGKGECAEKERVNTGRMVPPTDALFSIDGVLFLVDTIMEAVEGLRLLGCTSIRHTATYKDKANIFEVSDGIRLLIMPCLGNGKTYPTEVMTTK